MPLKSAKARKTLRSQLSGQVTGCTGTCHLDGLERTHDLIVEREGVFKECILAIKMAKVLGYQVATNTTIYKETDMQEIEANVSITCQIWG